MHQAFDFGKKGPIYEFEFYDGTPLDLEEIEALKEHKQITLTPVRRHRIYQEELKEIQKRYRAKEYPRSISLTGKYRDQAGQIWLRGHYWEKGENEPVDMIFNTEFWRYY